MNQTHFVFQPAVPMAEVRGTLQLALLAAEALYGADRLDVETRWNMDEPTRTVTIESPGEIGRTLAVLFLGYARREFGASAVRLASGSPDGPTPCLAGGDR